MRLVSLLLAALAATAALPVHTEQANAQAVAIVTAVDVSDSIDVDDLRLELEGLAVGVVDERFTSNLGAGAGFEVFAWSSGDYFVTLIPYTVLRSPSDAAVVAARLMAMDPHYVQRYPGVDQSNNYRQNHPIYGMTDIAAAIREGAARLLARPAGRMVLNVMADGPDNVSDPAPARDQAAALDIIVNAVIFREASPHEDRFWTDVVTGDGFVMVVEQAADLPVALKRKFIMDMVAAGEGWR